MSNEISKKYLDRIDALARELGSVDTRVNTTLCLVREHNDAMERHRVARSIAQAAMPVGLQDGLAFPKRPVNNLLRQSSALSRHLRSPPPELVPAAADASASVDTASPPVSQPPSVPSKATSLATGPRSVPMSPMSPHRLLGLHGGDGTRRVGELRAALLEPC